MARLVLSPDPVGNFRVTEGGDFHGFNGAAGTGHSFTITEGGSISFSGVSSSTKTYLLGGHDSERGSNGYTALNAALAAATTGGPSTVAKFLPIAHAYYNVTNAHPTNVSQVGANAMFGQYVAMQNLKNSDPAGIIGGTYDAAIDSFWNSWPVGGYGYAVWESEMENGSPPLAQRDIYAQAVAYWIKRSMKTILARGLQNTVRVGGNMMGISWLPNHYPAAGPSLLGRAYDYPWWNYIAPVPGDQAGGVDIRPYIFFGIDHYCRFIGNGASYTQAPYVTIGVQYCRDTPTGPAVADATFNGEILIDVLGRIQTLAHSKGIHRFAIFESGLDRRVYDNSGLGPVGTEAQQATWINNTLIPYLTAHPEIEAYSWFHKATGTASQYDQLTGVALTAYADACKNLSVDRYP